MDSYGTSALLANCDVCIKHGLCVRCDASRGQIFLGGPGPHDETKWTLKDSHGPISPPKCPTKSYKSLESLGMHYRIRAGGGI